jgi:hypothetical protein
MSKQLTLSATFSVLAMAAFALVTTISALERGDAASDGAATAHGSLLQVVLAI